MKRDWDLVRTILKTIEDGEHGNAPDPMVIDGYSREKIGYHVYLMGEGGLLRVVDVTHMASNSPEALALSMTWAGHEFLDAARKDTTWNRAMDKAKAIGSVTLPIIQSLLQDMAKSLLSADGSR